MTAPAVAVPGRAVGAQILATGLGEGAARLSQILTVALAARALGVEGLAVVGIAWSLTALALAFVQGGPDLVGSRSLGLGDRADQTPTRVIAAVTRLKLVMLAAAAPCLVGALLLLGHTGPQAMAQLGGQAVASGFSALGFAWAFRGLCRPGDQIRVRVAQAVISLLVLAPLLVIWPNPLAVPVAEAIGALAALLIGRARLAGLGISGMAHGPETRSMLAPSLALGLSGLVTTLAWMAPVLAAARWAPLEVVSNLTGTMRLLLGCIGILQLGFQALYPIQARLLAVDAARAKGATLAIALQAAFAAAIGAALLILFAPWLVRLLLGPDFGPAADFLRALAPLLLPVAIASPVSYALMALGEMRLVARISVGTALAMAAAAALGFALLPPERAILVLHPILWAQVVVILAAGWRRGLIGPAGLGAANLLAPWRLGRLLRDG